MHPLSYNTDKWRGCSLRQLSPCYNHYRELLELYFDPTLPLIVSHVNMSYLLPFTEWQGVLVKHFKSFTEFHEYNISYHKNAGRYCAAAEAYHVISLLRDENEQWSIYRCRHGVHRLIKIENIHL